MKNLSNFKNFLNENNSSIMILDAPCMGKPDSKYQYRWIVQLSDKSFNDSVLKVQIKYTDWENTPGQWYVGTILNKEGYMGGQISDKIFIDQGQNWYVTGLNDAVLEIKDKLGI